MRRTKMLGNQGIEQDEVDLTPMLDVVFILLIFFVVTASFLKEQAIPVELPPESPSKNGESTSLVIHIDADNQLKVDGRTIALRALRAVIEQKKAEGQLSGVVVLAHQMSQAGTYVAVADAARIAGVEQIVLQEVQANNPAKGEIF